MLKKIVIIFNATAGCTNLKKWTPQQLAALFAQHQIESSSLRLQAADFKTQLQKAIEASPDMIVAAGGDGTASAVASQIWQSKIPLGVLPMGTLNHFAKDLGIPVEIEAAVNRLAQGEKTAVDIAEVNGHYFINNSAIGLYPHLAGDRDEQMDKVQRNKWIALIIAAYKVWFKFPLTRLDLCLDNQNIQAKTPLVFIGNNHFDLNALFARKALNDGKLCVYLLKCTRRFGLFKVLWQALFKGAYEAADLEAYHIERLSIHKKEAQKGRKIKVACDGEVMHFNSPLEYTIHKQALWVIR